MKTGSDVLGEEASYRTDKPPNVEERLYQAITDFARNYGFTFGEAVEVIMTATARCKKETDE